MRKMCFRIPAEYEGRKVIHFLRGRAGCSATLVRWLKTYPDGILLNGRHARTIDLLHGGDLLELSIREPETQRLERCELEVPILYEDEDVIAFNKPASMPCHPSRRYQQGTLANVYARLWDQRGEKPSAFRALNRLDRNTTGVVLAAKNAYAAAAIAGTTGKSYVGAVQGVPWPPKRLLEFPIGRPNDRDVRRAVMEGGQKAVTHYTVFGVSPDFRYSIVLCTLLTGRTHQIRVHMAHIGNPLLGDELYGGSCEEIQRQALHCCQMRFISPSTKEQIKVNAPIPQDMQKFVEGVRQTY